jgi:hypothetical protein
MRQVFILLVVVACVCADLYMHNPRGSNDRLDEANTNRNNANRLYDSQNNAKGGYCVGPAMTYYVGSQISVEWTNQHGCGSNPKLICNMVVQYMCGAESDGDYFNIRDGSTTDTITNDATGPVARETNGDYTFGMHESYQSYKNCETRNRNMGIYIADREDEGGLNAGRAAAIFTRQNNNGNRHGYECVEERDYYPYWHPAQWVDVAILAHKTEYCEFYQAESQNVKAKGYCASSTAVANDPTQPTQTAENNPTDCSVAGNTWMEQPAFGVAAPDCLEVPWSRDNHLGNGQGAHNNLYNWTLPTSGDFSTIAESQNTTNCLLDTEVCNCVVRLRYNISTSEFGFDMMSRPDTGFIDWTYNAGASPLIDDEIVMQDGAGHELALDTTQFGRTFEDRSHVFHIASRPDNVDGLARIFNLNVRGKRGNIVQAYPSTEYDFAPSFLYTRVGDYIHFQWTGCDNNPAGNAGEGTDGTDRHNVVQTTSSDNSHPATDEWILENEDKVLFRDAALRLRMAMLDQVGCLTREELLAKNNNDNNAEEQDIQNCMKLNAAPRYFDGGAQRMNNTGTFHYMSTRNHNFSNRDQKGIIYVVPLLPTWAVALIISGAGLFVGAAGVAGMMFYAKSHPHSGVANMFSKM